MDITGFYNLEYKHHSSGKMYTLICVGDTFFETEDGKQRIPHAVYRQHESGEIFIRPQAEFEQKFTQVFPSLEKLLDGDDNLIREHCDVTERQLRRRRLALLGVARALWMLFPLTSVVARENMIRTLNFADFVDGIGTHLVDRLNDAQISLAHFLKQAGASLHTSASTGATAKLDGSTGEESLALLMLGMATTWREYTVLKAMTVDAEDAIEQQEHLNRIQLHIDSLKATAMWMENTGIKVALPKLELSANFTELEVPEGVEVELVDSKK